MRNKGFTLVEMAIVLIIVGVMTAGGVKMIYSAMDTNKFTNSRNQIESIVKEIAEFSGRARRIPADFAELSNIVTPLTDAFEQTILYTPANGITGNTANICNVDSTTITVKQCVDAGCTSSTDHENVAFVVTSGSINENIQVTDSTIDYLIYEDGITIDGHTADINRSENYDDLVSWLTLDALKKFAGCTGSAIQIIEDMIPSAYSESTYSTQLHPLGGVGPYKWCIESDEAEIQENFFYSTNTINNIDGCTGNYITAPDTITINTNNIVLDSATDTFPPNSKVRVFLQDNNGVQTSKEFSLNVKQPYELVLNDMNGTPTSPLTSEVTNASDFVVSATGGNGNGNGNAIIAVSNTEIEILLNTNVTSAYIFNNCNANPNAADACPAFGNHGLLSAYFTLDYQEKNNAPTPMGFTFAVIKSYIAGTTYTRAPNTLGGADDGLGYGGSGGDEIGMQGGNSFAVEFDLHKNNEKNDINNDHIAIVSFANKNNYDESYDDTTGISNNDQTYTSYGNNIHTSIGTPTNWVMTFNTECSTSGTTGTGCYYDNSSDVIPNNWNSGSDDRLGIRVEAISGCNSAGTECNKKTGANNYVCVFVWRSMKSDMNADATLATSMMDTTVSHSYNYIVYSTALPIFTPQLAECIPDDTNSLGTLDHINFGFTSSSWGDQQNQLSYGITELSINSGQY